jgi:uncharacterized membrane protein
MQAPMNRRELLRLVAAGGATYLARISGPVVHRDRAIGL